MSYVIAAPEVMTSAATDLANIGSNLSAANAAAATGTAGVLAAAEDEVSAAIAAVFSAHGQGFQALGAQAAAFHDQFVQALTACAHRPQQLQDWPPSSPSARRAAPATGSAYWMRLGWLSTPNRAAGG